MKLTTVKQQNLQREPIITIVIPIRNRWGARVKNCLRSIQLQSVKPIEIIVSDYGSDSRNHGRLRETLKPFDCTIYHTQTSEVWSRSLANNIGIRRAEAKYVATLDVDAMLDPRVMEFIIKLHQGYEERDKKAIIGSQVYHLPDDLDLEDLDLPRSADGNRNNYELLRIKGKMLRPGFGVMLCAASEWWHRVRGFDERIKGWGAGDNDLWDRAKRDGLSHNLLNTNPFPQINIYHQWHKTHSLAKEIGNEEFYRLYRINAEIWKNDWSIIRNDANWGMYIIASKPKVSTEVPAVPAPRVHPPPLRISSSMICWNEAQTIDLALKSIANFIDEVIILDTGSTDGTQKIAQECIDTLDLSGYVRQIRVNQLGQARLKGYELCDGDWVLMQDANLILSNALKAEIRNHVNSYKQRRDANVGRIHSLNLMGDYEHYFANQPFMAPHRVFVRADEAKWRLATDRPKFGGRMITFNNWAVNLSRVRPAWRYWYRGEQFDRRYHTKGRGDDFINRANIQRRWQDSGKYYSIPEYVEKEMEITLDDVERIAPNWFLTQLQLEAAPLTPEMRMGLPEVINKELKSPRYRLVYEGGKIIGRWPDL